MRNLERIIDDTGWKFYMPRIDYNDMDRYNIGTLDLADWTFGTWKSLLSIWMDDKIEYSFLERVFWRLENILRLLYWYVFLIELEYMMSGKKLQEYFVRIVRKPLELIRLSMFRLARVM